jgi:hypothetical protein
MIQMLIRIRAALPRRGVWARKVDLLYIGDQFRASALHEEK